MAGEVRLGGQGRNKIKTEFSGKCCRNAIMEHFTLYANFKNDF